MSDTEGLNRRSFIRSAGTAALAGSTSHGAVKYDFDTPYSRIGTDSIKWDHQIKMYGRENIAVGMGVADMDFRAAPAITKALLDRVHHENWGYLDMPHSFAEAIINWNKRRYGIDIKPELLLMSTGVHPSIVSALRAFSPRGSKVLLMTPTYDGFFGDIAAAGCKPEESPLKLVDGRYQIDAEELERHISSETRTLILCNPQNPTGNCWTPQDLTTVGEICTRRGVVLLVDEIHCDFVTKGNRYTPFITLPDKTIVKNSITFKSASKSFGLSAMKCGWMFSENPNYIARIVATGHSGDINTLGVIAAQAAYTQGEDWLNQLVAYIDGNHDFLTSFLRSEMPLITVAKAQGTYLAWLDITQVAERIGAHKQAAAASRPITPETIVQQFFIKNAKVQINTGNSYGRVGAGHMRMNLATSRKTMEFALTSMANALKKV